MDQMNLFAGATAPVLVAWGAGVDSTAMLVELVERGERVNHVLTADTGAEHPDTYAFRDVFIAWLEARGVPVTVIKYEPTKFKHEIGYRSIDDNCVTNSTLPSISFGGKGCSQKWKVEPQNRWAKTWAPAQACWAAGGKVVKLIGYDCSPADSNRYAHAEGHNADELYEYRYPLREWGWTRKDCEARIARAGLPVPRKSACYMCCATKPHELEQMPCGYLRRIVLIEAQAEHRYKVPAPGKRPQEGLWRHSVKGMRGATARPGSMSQYIADKGLLPAEDIATVKALAPIATGSADAMIAAARAGYFDAAGAPAFYAHVR